VQTQSGVIAPRLTADGRVTVDMGRPEFDPTKVPFDAAGLVPVAQGLGQKWPLPPDGKALSAIVLVAIVSMGNPHAVQLVDNVDTAPVQETGPLIESHPRFPQRVNAGYLQIVDRAHVRLRVFERGVGETLACGTGACAAVAAGIRLGLLDPEVQVDTRGGRLTIAWSGQEADSVFMTGPATTVFEGQIDIPDTLV
jgi:diaminopimelate epimerase